MGSINWKSASEGSYPKLEPKVYLMEVEGWERSESKKAKAPQIRWEYLLVEDDNPLGGAKFSEYQSLSEAALWKVASLVKACGIDVTTLPEMVVGTEEFYKVLNMLKGRKVFVEVIDEMYEGKLRNKVKGYMPYDEQPAAEPYGEKPIPDFVKNKLRKAGLV